MGETLPEALASEGYSPGHKGQLRAAVFSRVLGHGCILGCVECSEVAQRVLGVVLDGPLIEDGSTGEPCHGRGSPRRNMRGLPMVRSDQDHLLLRNNNRTVR